MRTRDERWHTKLGPFQTAEDRNAAIVLAYSTHSATMQVIADAFGMTRQRVQQIVARELGRGNRVYAGEAAIVETIVRQTPSIQSFYGLARAVGWTPKAVRHAVRRLGLEPQVIRLFAWRKRRRAESSRQAIVALYVSVRTDKYAGVPLTVDQMAENGIRPNALYKMFGRNYIAKFRALAGEAQRKKPVKREAGNA